MAGGRMGGGSGGDGVTTYTPTPSPPRARHPPFSLPP